MKVLGKSVSINDMYRSVLVVGGGNVMKNRWSSDTLLLVQPVKVDDDTGEVLFRIKKVTDDGLRVVEGEQ